MKKTLRVMILTFMMVLCMAGCGKEQDELLDYVNGDARKEVIELEKKAKQSYSGVTGDNYKDDNTTLQEFSTNTSDLAKQAVDKAASMGKKLEGEKLKKVHELYVASLKDFQSGVDQFIQALENGDADMMNQVNETISRANEESSNCQKELKKLAEELDVEVETKSLDIGK